RAAYPWGRLIAFRSRKGHEMIQMKVAASVGWQVMLGLNRLRFGLMVVHSRTLSVGFGSRLAKASRTSASVRSPERILRNRLTDRAQPPRDSLAKYARLFEGRARSGKCFHRPYLGCREFDANFEWVDDPDTVPLGVDEWPRAGEDLGLMLYDVFDPARRTTGD